jgi:oligopeptide/dipeptide ABC transporter ATP-binding protein
MFFEVSGLSVEYTTLNDMSRAVNDVYLSADRGEVVGIVGESGCGKSTLALALLGLTRRNARIMAGSVSLDGQALVGGGGLSDKLLRHVRGRRIGLITQNARSSLNPTVRIGKQIATVYATHTGEKGARARAAAIAALRLVGINDPERRFDAYPHELSGGMAQRAVIAMAIVCRPDVVIADEATSRLDVTIQAQILDDLQRSVQEVGSSLVLITQDLGVIANYADRLYVMNAGEIVETAPTPVLFETPGHPASVSLLESQLDLSEQGLRLRGLPVDGRALPEGCWLQARCPFMDVQSGCRTVHPELSDVGAGHQARCHRASVVVSRAAELTR